MILSGGTVRPLGSLWLMVGFTLVAQSDLEHAITNALNYCCIHDARTLPGMRCNKALTKADIGLIDCGMACEHLDQTLPGIVSRMLAVDI